MKKLLKISMFAGLVLTALQCSDPCKKISCEHGTCEDGTCLCEQGYEGELCDIRKSAVFAGVWTGNFVCDTVNREADILIEEDPYFLDKLKLNSDGIEFNFNGLTFTLDKTTLKATINGSYDKFTIDTQTMTIEIPNNPGISAEVFGSGNLINKEKIELDINVENKDFGAAFNCTSTLTR
jgi:hypothetical protein